MNDTAPRLRLSAYWEGSLTEDVTDASLRLPYDATAGVAFEACLRLLVAVGYDMENLRAAAAEIAKP